MSLLAGATPGIHFPIAKSYIRRVRLAKNSNLIKHLAASGYKMEDDKYDSSTLCVEFPVTLGNTIRTLDDVSLWEQLQLAAIVQQFWSDNQVSCTVTFD